MTGEDKIDGSFASPSVPLTFTRSTQRSEQSLIITYSSGINFKNDFCWRSFRPWNIHQSTTECPRVNLWCTDFQQCVRSDQCFFNPTLHLGTDSFHICISINGSWPEQNHRPVWSAGGEEWPKPEFDLWGGQLGGGCGGGRLARLLPQINYRLLPLQTAATDDSSCDNICYRWPPFRPPHPTITHSDLHSLILSCFHGRC